MSEQEISSLLSANVFVLGDLVLDEYVFGQVSRISPEAPVPVLTQVRRSYVPGGAANVAANVADFGAKALICGRVGTDHEAQLLRNSLESRRVNWLGLVDSTICTTVKTRYLAGYQQIMRADRENVADLSAALEAQAIEHFKAFLSIQGPKCLVVSDYGKGVVTPFLVKHLASLAKQAGVPVVTDPKSRNLEKYAGTTVVKPNLAEACAALNIENISGKNSGERRANGVLPFSQSQLVTLLDLAQADSVVLSLSERGVVAFARDWEEPFHAESVALEVADVSGAGDTMVAFLAMGAAVGFDLKRSTSIANTASGVVCGKLGTATLSSAELFTALHSHDGGKILSQKGAVYFAQRWRDLGKKVVFTNGCFDLLHAGHVDLLQRARALGDALVVGLNSDSSVKRLKGPSRPIQDELDRASILAGLASVDGVVLFEQDTPLELICDLRPDVLVKGGDYAPHQVVGHKEVAQWGGRVEIVPLVLGRSTSNIETKIRESLQKAQNKS